VAFKRKRQPGFGSSVVQDRKAQLVQVCRIGDHIDGDDLASPDCETQEEQEPFTRGHNDSHRSFHKHRLCEPGVSQEMPGCPGRPGDGLRTADLPCRASGHGCAVGSEVTRSMLLVPSCSCRAAQPRKAISPIQGKPESRTTAKLCVRVAN